MDARGYERSLVLRAQSGDRGAFDELLQRVDDSLLRYITTITCGRAPAEDVLQDVLIVIVRKIVWLRDPDLFRAWAFRIASRAAFRAIGKDVTVPLEEDRAAPADDQPDPWLLRRLGSALPRLTDASRVVIHLHYLEDMPLSDVAAALEISIGTAKSRLAYGLAQLRKELAT